jgi:ABC-2 type transport system ATP-binding protein
MKSSKLNPVAITAASSTSVVCTAGTYRTDTPDTVSRPLLPSIRPALSPIAARNRTGVTCAAMNGAVIATEGLGHAYGSVVALHDLDLEVPPGRIGLVGANGAGKSTLIRIMLGILRPTVGKARIFGLDSRTDELEIRSRVGYMPEVDCLPLDVSASDFLYHAATLAGLPGRAARQRASDVLGLVGLDEERFRPLGGFSTGMKQRTKLAQAIVHDPDLVFLDEPTAGLDPQGREEMLGLIERLGGFGIDVLVSSHVLGDIERTCDWVVMLEGGRAIRSGALSSLIDQDVVEVEPLDRLDEVAAALHSRGAAVEHKGARLLVTHPGADPFLLVRDTLADLGVGLRMLGPRQTTLEDVFLAEGGAA